MRKLIVLIGALVSVISTSVALAPQTQAFNNSALQSQKLKVHLLAEKRLYKRGDKIGLKAMIINKSDQDLFVHGNLEWGHLASLTLCLRDAKGRTVQPRFISDAVTYLPDDKSEFVKLHPFHFLGTSYIASTEELSLQRPGRYSIFIEYHSPTQSSKADVSPFYGKENGVIRSNSIWIEIQ